MKTQTTILNLTTCERGELLSRSETTLVVLTEKGTPAVWAVEVCVEVK